MCQLAQLLLSPLPLSGLVTSCRTTLGRVFNIYHFVGRKTSLGWQFRMVCCQKRRIMCSLSTTPLKRFAPGFQQNGSGTAPQPECIDTGQANRIRLFSYVMCQEKDDRRKRWRQRITGHTRGWATQHVEACAAPCIGYRTSPSINCRPTRFQMHRATRKPL